MLRQTMAACVAAALLVAPSFASAATDGLATRRGLLILGADRLIPLLAYTSISAGSGASSSTEKNSSISLFGGSESCAETPSSMPIPVCKAPSFAESQRQRRGRSSRSHIERSSSPRVPPICACSQSAQRAMCHKLKPTELERPLRSRRALSSRPSITCRTRSWVSAKYPTTAWAVDRFTAELTATGTPGSSRADSS